MKKILLTLSAILLTTIAFSQTIINNGTANQLLRQRGGTLNDSILQAPVRDTTAIYPLAPLGGRLQVSHNRFYYNNGTYWRRVANFSEIPTNTNQLSNGSGFITGITSTNVITALGYIPYDAAINSSGFVSSGALVSTLSAYTLLTTYNAGIATKQNTLVSGTNIKTVDGQSLLGSGNISLPVLSAGTGINIASNVITNTSPDQTVTLTAGNRISITGTYPNFTISYIEPIINIITSKTLNSNFTISSTKQAFATYSLTCSVTNPLLAGSSTANVFLEYSTNGGSAWLLPSQNGNSSSVALAVAIAITNGQTVTVSGVIPANALVRLRTTTSGTASITYVTGQEVY